MQVVAFRVAASDAPFTHQKTSFYAVDTVGRHLIRLLGGFERFLESGHLQRQNPGLGITTHARLRRTGRSPGLGSPRIPV